MNKDRLNVYNNYIEKYSPSGFKYGLKYAACFYIGATVACLIAGFISPLLCIFGAIDLANLLILPLAMLISNPVAWATIGVIFIAGFGVAMGIANPLFHLAKDLINERRATEKEKDVGKDIKLQALQDPTPVTQAPVTQEEQARPKTPDRDSGTVTPEIAITEDSFVDKTNNGDYKGWLTQSDITSIARVRYGWKAHLDRKGLKHPHQGVIFTCLGDVESLKCELEEYKVKVKEDGNLLFASVLNINGNHWVTLVVAYNQGDKQFRAYYCDPRGNGLPKLPHIGQQKKDLVSVFEDPSALKELQECISPVSYLFYENLILQGEKDEEVKERLDYVRKQIDKLTSKGIGNKILKEWIDSLSKLIDDLIQQKKDGVTEDLDSIKNRAHELSKKNNVISLDKDYVTCLLQQTLEISDDNVRSSNAEQQKDTWNCGIFAPKNAKIITDALKAGEFDEIDAKLQYTLTPKQLIEERKEFAETLKKDEQSIVSVQNKRNRRSSGDTVASSVSSESGISVGSEESKQTQRTEVKAYDTVGDGNCFFHSVFGKKDYTYMTEVYKDGVYRAERAQEMREEWHKFLSQFTSLNDPRMPKALKEQLQKVFGAFLEKPGDLTGRSDAIKGLAEQTNKKIKNAEDSAKELVNDIVSGLKVPQNEAIGNLREYAEALNPDNFDEDTYRATYNSDTITNSFLNDEVLYKSYLEAISKQAYYVFAEEIPILASLAGIEITVHYKDNGDDAHKVFEPNPEIIEVFNSNTNSVEVYQRNSELWGDKEQEIIYLKPGHYERAKDIPLTPPPSRTESLSSLQSVLSYCPIM